MQEIILYVFLAVMGLFVGSIATALWLLPRFIYLRTELDAAWDDVETALQAPSDDTTVPEYRKFLLQRMSEVKEARRGGK